MGPMTFQGTYELLSLCYNIRLAENGLHNTARKRTMVIGASTLQDDLLFPVA